MTVRGGFQPDTTAPSARRADFDLLRRVAAIEAWIAAGGGGPGPGPGAGGSYVHNQAVASASWVIPHNLGFYPNVIVEDSAGTTIEGEVVYNSANQLTLTFSAAFAGIAYLS